MSMYNFIICECVEAFILESLNTPFLYVAVESDLDRFWLVMTFHDGSYDIIEEWQFDEARERHMDKLAVAQILEEQMDDLEKWASEPVF